MPACLKRNVVRYSHVVRPMNDNAPLIRVSDRVLAYYRSLDVLAHVKVDRVPPKLSYPALDDARYQCISCPCAYLGARNS